MSDLDLDAAWLVAQGQGSLEILTAVMELAISSIWDAEWRRADLCAELVKVYNKDQIKAMMNALGRSHQDVYRWAKLAEAFPPDKRRLDRSPQTHMAYLRKHT